VQVHCDEGLASLVLNCEEFLARDLYPHYTECLLRFQPLDGVSKCRAEIRFSF
jgi:hypothetical protein